MLLGVLCPKQDEDRMCISHHKSQYITMCEPQNCPIREGEGSRWEAWRHLKQRGGLGARGDVVTPEFYLKPKNGSKRP